jgi:hypothetical protein
LLDPRTKIIWLMVYPFAVVRTYIEKGVAMGQRRWVMDQQTVEPEWDEPGPSGDGQGAVVVIANDGADPSVLILPRPGSQLEGKRFSYQDRSWVITCQRLRTSVYFAEPSV